MRTVHVVGFGSVLFALLLPSCADDEGAKGNGAAGSFAVAGAASGGSSAAAGASSVSSGGTAGGSVAGGGSSASGGSTAQQGGKSGASAAGAEPGTGTGSGGVPPSGSGCDAPGLEWKTAAKTNFESYPAPGSEECIKYNGCTWAGEFAFCEGKKSEDWVSQHDIVAVFPADGLEGHSLCLKKGDKTIVVTVLDTCGDSDCDGCCTENRGDADALIDLEKYTNERWGVEDGEIQFADLGANAKACE